MISTQICYIFTWSMYPFVGMITLERIGNDYEKKIALRVCKMQDVENLSEN